LACYCVIIALVFGTVDEGSSQGQEIMLVVYGLGQRFWFS